MNTDTITPMMQQYLSVKKENSNAVIFFRLGDFYETFFDDAVLASKILEITLTSREAGKGNKVPMAGIPYHAADSYIARLIKAGHRVAICEQMEDPRKAKGLVKREVTRIITPGTALDGNLLTAKENRYLAAVCFQGTGDREQRSEEKKLETRNSRPETSLGLSYLDLSTGEFVVFETDDLQEFLAQLMRVHPTEILIQEDEPVPIWLSEAVGQISAMMTKQPGWVFGRDRAFQLLTNYFHVNSLEGFGCQDLSVGLGSAGAILHYIQEIQPDGAIHLRKLRHFRTEKTMVLDPATQRNLELVRTLKGEQGDGSLLSVLDETVTSMGGRLLRQWITQPLLDVEEIVLRHEAVEELAKNSSLLGRIRELLQPVGDLERQLGRLSCGAGNARDLLGLNQSLKQIPKIRTALEAAQSTLLMEVKLNLADLTGLTEFLDRSIHLDPPITLRDGRLIKSGYHAELDELRSITEHGKEWIARLEQEEVKKTGITSLKIRYNRVFGYYIEVTNANLKHVPDYFIRKQTLANAERFITPELKEWEAKVLGAEERILELEYEIFQQVRGEALKETGKIQQSAQAVALVDTLASLSWVAVKNHYVRPEVNQGGIIEIVDGRHPVIEQLLMGERFVPNDLLLDDQDQQILIITGPNMAGKSTYIRQAALIVLMAQMGSFIPAKKGTIGVVDRIFTRVGAQDELTRGQSTFMVEMNETANILNNATERSLLILDEIGRGTSTFDGISIAWAIAEYLHDHVKAKTLFATHYHELTELELVYSRIKNYHVEVKEWGEQIVFLRKIVSGGTDKSYGIHVGRLAGLPAEVIQRAKKILIELEQATLTSEGKPKLVDRANDGRGSSEHQWSFFDPHSEHSIMEEIKKADVDKMSPLEALNFLAGLKKKTAEEQP